MRLFRLCLLFAFSLLGHSAELHAQPKPVSVELALKDGKTLFKTGEPIVLELQFRAQQSGVNVSTNGLGDGGADELIMEAKSGRLPTISDVERWMPGQHDVVILSPVSPGQPLIVPLALNEVYQFDEPGQYTLHVLTRRAGEPLRTNEVSFTVHASSPEEDAARARALAQSISRPRCTRDAMAAGQALGWMSSDAATRVKLDLILGPRKANPCDVNLMQGLWRARNRQLVIDTLDAALMDPSRVPTVHDAWASYLSLFMSSVQSPVKVDPRADETLKREIYLRLVHRLATTLSQRQGESLLQTALLVFRTFGREEQAMEQPDVVAARDVLLAHFAEIGRYQLDTLLDGYGKQLDEPRVIAAVERFLMKHPNYQSALNFLVQYRPAEAAPFIVREACSDKPVLIKSVRDLPAQTLPEIDACLQRRLQAITSQGIPNRQEFAFGQTMAHVARFATPALVPEVARILPMLQEPGMLTDARGAALAYLMRWEPQTYTPQFEAALAAASVSSLPHAALQAAWLPADGQRAVYRKRLMSGSPAEMEWAAHALAQLGAAEDRALLDESLQRLQERLRRGDAGSADEERLETALIAALLTGPDWSRAKADALIARCVSATCKRNYRVR